MKPNLRFEVQVVISQAKEGKGVLGRGIHFSKGQESQENEACLGIAHTVWIEQIMRKGVGFARCAKGT